MTLQELFKHLQFLVELQVSLLKLLVLKVETAILVLQALGEKVPMFQENSLLHQAKLLL